MARSRSGTNDHDMTGSALVCSELESQSSQSRLEISPCGAKGHQQGSPEKPAPKQNPVIRPVTQMWDVNGHSSSPWVVTPSPSGGPQAPRCDLPPSSTHPEVPPGGELHNADVDAMDCREDKNGGLGLQIDTGLDSSGSTVQHITNRNSLESCCTSGDGRPLGRVSTSGEELTRGAPDFSSSTACHGDAAVVHGQVCKAAIPRRRPSSAGPSPSLLREISSLQGGVANILAKHAYGPRPASRSGTTRPYQLELN